jgi:flagellar assembly factor FliW
MIGSAVIAPDPAIDGTLPMQHVEKPTHPPVITFAEGLLGFDDARRFALLRTEDPGLFWLQSLEHEPLAFLLLDPFRYFDGYTVDLDPVDITELDARGPGEIAILAIVTLPASPDEPCTANLAGPIAINLEQGRGRQVILRDTAYSVREPVELGGS